MYAILQNKTNRVNRDILEFTRKLIDPLKGLFFQKVEKGEIDAELNEKLFRFFSDQG